MNNTEQNNEFVQNRNNQKKEVTMKTTKNIKNSRKGLVLTIAAFLIIAVSLIMQPVLADARGRFGPQRSPDEIVQHLTDRLDLTPEQAAEIEPIIQESFEKRNDVRDKYFNEKTQTRNTMRNEMKAIGDETHAQLSTILDDEQIEAFLGIQEENRARKDKRHGRRGPKRF